jgi:uncharacterized protein (DUF58 family)
MIRITGPGWAYLLLTLLLGLVAVNTGNNLIYLVESAFLASLAVSGFFGKRNLSRLRVDLLPPEEIFAGAGHPWRITVRNDRTRMAALLIRVTWRGGSFLIPYLPPGGSGGGFLTAAFPERGRHPRGEVRIESRYPFGLFIRSRRVDPGDPVIVFPRPLRADLPAAAQAPPDPGSVLPVNRKGDDPEVLLLRDYLEGDSVRHIDWKASARTGELKTKEMAGAAAAPLWIHFDRVPAASREERISRVAHWLLEGNRRGMPVGLVMEGRTHPPASDRGGLRRMLEDLALLGLETEGAAKGAS